MQRKFLCFLAGLACVSLLNLGCNKLDSTILGEDLIPAVDNVTTFALDTLQIIAGREQNIDTTKLGRGETHALGSINNDPIFGKTKADIFLELKPTSFPYYFGNAGDTIKSFDSAFLCLSYTGFYGDTLKAQHFKVYLLDENTSNFVDTISYKLDFQPAPYPTNLIGQGTVYEPALKNYLFLNNSAKDSVTRQIRIKLDPAFLTAFVGGDTSVPGTNPNTNHSFRNDSLFKEKYKGFAVVADGDNNANGLFYVNLTDATTRLEIHYVATHGTLDTAFATFPVQTGATLSASATANFVKRDTIGSEATSNPSSNALYIQSAPGSAINISIPGLATMPNRIIHRAEIILEQATPVTPVDNVLTAPQYLYLDLKDDTSTATKYKPIYYDLAPNEIYNPDNTTLFFPTAVDNAYYGGFLRTKTDVLGTRSYYTFNITRYLQNMVTKRTNNYKFRVYAPYDLNYYNLSLTYKNNLAFGRIKINNGTDPNYKIRLHIVYSNL